MSDIVEGTPTRPAREQMVQIELTGVILPGDLIIPQDARGLIVFVHGSGSSRHSARNRAVAATLQEGRLGTLLFDLLTPEEEAVDRTTGEYRFDIARLSDRLIGVLDWIMQRTDLAALPLGLFGASTGAAAALIAAARRPAQVAAVVSRGGRPDLAYRDIARVRAPTLLIVGSYDTPVIDLNRDVLPRLRCTKSLVIIPQATHLFEEPGALAMVARLARDWFRHHLL